MKQVQIYVDEKIIYREMRLGLRWGWPFVDFQLQHARLAFSFASFSFGQAKGNEGPCQAPCD